MARLVVFALALTMLISCGMLNKLEEKTDEVYGSVESTNKKLDETKDGQMIGAALELMSDPAKSPNVRAAAAETIFIKAPEDRVYKYIGAPAPLDRLSIPVPNGPATMISIPNVSYVGDKLAQDIFVAPVSEDLHGIQSVAIVNLLKQLSVESKTPGLDPNRLNTLRALFPRVRNVATVVIGSKSVDEIRALMRPTEKAVVKPTDRQALKIETAFLLREVASSLGLPQAEIDAMEPFIEARLGISRNP